jgi:hypothetical protein
MFARRTTEASLSELVARSSPGAGGAAPARIVGSIDSACPGGGREMSRWRVLILALHCVTPTDGVDAPTERAG